MPETPGRKAQTPDLEREREALIGRAESTPGVAEVVKAYGRLAKYRVTRLGSETKTRFATGANG